MEPLKIVWYPLANAAGIRQNHAIMRTKILLATLLPAAAFAQGADYNGKYNPCIDYYTVGNSNCQPQASTPVVKQVPVSVSVSVSNTQQIMDQKIDKYLENYGKPPREFVEFYLNPTPENAQKWVVTYNAMIQKSQNLSQSWSQADALYQQMQAGSAPASAQPAVVAPPPPAETTETAPVPAEMRLGAFAQTGLSTATSSGLEETVHITYFFSKTCPYCAKMTPQLSNIFNEMPSKLTLTCVDVTPLSTTYKPEPANIEGKLPCQWRLPEEGEVERLAVKQTPTMFIKHRQGQPVRISGYLPLAELKNYIIGKKADPAL